MTTTLKKRSAAAGTPQGLSVGFIVRTDGNRLRGAEIRVEQKYKAIRPIEAHGIELVARIELLIPSSGGKVAGEQFVDHRGQFALHGLRESLPAFPEEAAGLVKLANRSRLPIRQAPPPGRLRT